MNFYICIDSWECVEPEIYDGDTFSRRGADSRHWFERLIYVCKEDDDQEDCCFRSVAQDLDLVWGGYVYRNQVQPLKVKRTL